MSQAACKIHPRPSDLIMESDVGLFCDAGQFHVDPSQSVPCAIITHAHADHVTAGCGRYITSEPGLRILRYRLGDDAVIEAWQYGERHQQGSVEVSLHPAGHIRGSAQVRIESPTETAVVTGDFKTDEDPTCAPYEQLRCDTLIMESTFALPLFRWPSPRSVLDEIQEWWGQNQQRGRASILFCYALGKAQRVLAELDPNLGPVYTHGAVENICQLYRNEGVRLPETHLATDQPRKTNWSQGLVLAPPAAHNSPWLRRFGRVATGFVSGWMRVRGVRRRRAYDRGFVMSDHADWPGLLRVVAASEAQRVFATHGFTGPLSRHLREFGIQAGEISTQFRGEESEDAPEAGI